MKATCPNNKDHKEFFTTAHVMQSWKVDELGGFLEVADECIEVVHSPNEDNLWECTVCGEFAKVVKYSGRKGEE